VNEVYEVQARNQGRFGGSALPSLRQQAIFRRFTKHGCVYALLMEIMKEGYGIACILILLHDSSYGISSCPGRYDTIRYDREFNVDSKAEY